MMNTIICAAGCDAKTGTDEELEVARKLCIDATGIILSEEQRKVVRTAPNAVEEYHEMKEVSTLSWRSSRIRQSETGEGKVDAGNVNLCRDIGLRRKPSQTDGIEEEVRSAEQAERSGQATCVRRGESGDERDLNGNFAWHRRIYQCSPVQVFRPVISRHAQLATATSNTVRPPCSHNSTPWDMTRTHQTHPIHLPVPLLMRQWDPTCEQFSPTLPADTYVPSWPKHLLPIRLVDFCLLGRWEHVDSHHVIQAYIVETVQGARAVGAEMETFGWRMICEAGAFEDVRLAAGELEDIVVE